jgi:hypothetical protein
MATKREAPPDLGGALVVSSKKPKTDLAVVSGPGKSKDVCTSYSLIVFDIHVMIHYMR